MPPPPYTAPPRLPPHASWRSMSSSGCAPRPHRSSCGRASSSRPTRAGTKRRAGPPRPSPPPPLRCSGRARGVAPGVPLPPPRLREAGHRCASCCACASSGARCGARAACCSSPSSGARPPAILTTYYFLLAVAVLTMAILTMVGETSTRYCPPTSSATTARACPSTASTPSTRTRLQPRSRVVAASITSIPCGCSLQTMGLQP